MKRPANQMSFFLLILILCIKMDDVVCSSSCNQAVLNLYGWCEQWTCNDNCTCAVHSDCRQYCDTPICRDMKCLSPSICKQKVHTSGSVQPHVHSMFARSPFVTQDCSGGICDIVKAKRHWKRQNGPKKRKQRTKKMETINTETVNRSKETTSAALQNCIGGVCQRLISTLQITKQFCTNCVKIHCMGNHATNCTQVCARGECLEMVCEADDCQQACLQNSTCNLRCSKNTKTCLQICEKGSKCKLACDASNCKQVCDDGKDCQKFQRGVHLSERISPTTSNTSSLKPTEVGNHTEINDTLILQSISVAVNLTTQSTNVTNISPSAISRLTKVKTTYLQKGNNLSFEQNTEKAGGSAKSHAEIFDWLIVTCLICFLWGT